MKEQHTILVYRYSFWDDRKRVQRVSVRYATLEAIRNGLGIPLQGDSKRVATTEVVGGLWTPIPADAR